jgi:hypothetical protein
MAMDEEELARGIQWTREDIAAMRVEAPKPKGFLTMLNEAYGNVEVREVPDAAFAIDRPGPLPWARMALMDQMDAAARHVSAISFIGLAEATPREPRGSIQVANPDGTVKFVRLGPERPVTLNMLNHADAILQANGIMDAKGEMIEEIYRAMAAHAPKYDPEYRALSDQLGDTCRERDAALAERDELRAMLILCGEQECSGVEGYPEKLRALIDGLIDVRGVKDVALALVRKLQGVHDLLASFTAANVPEPEPPKPNPFREFPGDRRRVGG